MHFYTDMPVYYLTLLQVFSANAT